MAAPTTIDEAIEQSALGPKRVRVGNTEREQFTPAELLAAKQGTAATTAGNRNHLGLRFMKIIPPGAG